MNRLLYFILLSCSSILAFAQGTYPSDNGLFTANYLKGCVGTTINVDPLFGTGAVFFCFEGDPSDVLSAENQTCYQENANNPNGRLTYTYGSSGTYTIIGFKEAAAGSERQFDSLTITIIAPQRPAITAINCDNQTYFDLNASAETFDFYSLDFGDGSTLQEYSINQFPIAHTYANNAVPYTVNISARLDNTGDNNCANNTNSFTITPADLAETAATINNITLVDSASFSIDYALNSFQNYTLQIKEGVNGTYEDVKFITNEASGTHTFTNLDVSNNFYCARIISNGLCTNALLVSNEVCNVVFSATATQNGNLLDWNSVQFENSAIFKNGQEISVNNVPYLDENVLCGQTDTYYVVVTDENNISHQSFSIEVEAIFGNPTAGIEQISVNTISDQELQLNWEVPAGLQPNEYFVYKKRNPNDKFFLLGTSTENEFIDVGLDFTTKTYTYGISYTNNCGGESQVQTFFQNILLKFALANNVLDLSWNSYAGYGSSLNEYTVNQYDGNMNLIATYPMSSDTSYTEKLAISDQQKYNYQIEAIATSGAKSYSNIISFKIPSSFFVPTAFTPDGNGLNEELKVLGKFIDQVDFKIYSRWGNLIFQSTSLNKGWDGYLTDREAPAGSYSYTVTVIDEFGESYFKSGVFNLIR